MFKKRLQQVLLPIVLMTTVAILAGLMIADRSLAYFRAQSNREAAAWIGFVLEQDPDVAQTEIMQVLENLSEGNELNDQIRAGQAVLAKYGYLEQDFASRSAEYVWRAAMRGILVSVVGMSLILAGYFWWKDWRYSRQIKRLVVYLQDLSTQTYDLRLEYNSENELSFLSNELYKITVLLKEAAELNRRERQNLEVALADISHQLRTPLTSLQVTLDNLYDDREMPEELRQDFLRSAGHQVEAMSDLVMTLLNLARLDNKTIQMHDSSLTAGELLHAVQEKVAVLADIADVEIVLTGDRDGIIEVDTKWQTEALVNIIKNCIEHSPAGEKITINVKVSPLFAKIIITDHGQGIPAGEVRRIFERFYRASNAVDGSIGIGLSFAKAIIEADGGQITVKSTEGEGTEFCVKYLRQG